MRISDWSSDVCSSDLACLHDGHQLARLAAAMTETLALAIPELPGLADDKLNQAASSILFQELLSIIETSRPYIPSMSDRSEEHTSELQSLMRNSYAVFCLKKKNNKYPNNTQHNTQQQDTKNTNTQYALLVLR